MRCHEVDLRGIEFRVGACRFLGDGSALGPEAMQGAGRVVLPASSQMLTVFRGVGIFVAAHGALGNVSVGFDGQAVCSVLNPLGLLRCPVSPDNSVYDERLAILSRLAPGEDATVLIFPVLDVNGPSPNRSRKFGNALFGDLITVAVSLCPCQNRPPKYEKITAPGSLDGDVGRRIHLLEDHGAVQLFLGDGVSNAAPFVRVLSLIEIGIRQKSLDEILKFLWHGYTQSLETKKGTVLWTAPTFTYPKCGFGL